MKVMILGSGGREHALAWKFAQSKRINGLFVAPGNGGTKAFATNLSDLDPTDSAAVVNKARELGIELVFVGPEVVLEAGVVDALNAAGIPAIGPEKREAQLESSKAFTKQLLLKHNIPTAQAKIFSDVTTFNAFIDTLQGMWVIKKSGLAAGKGVLESSDREEIRSFGLQALKDDSVVLEEFLVGYEVSIFTVSDAKTYCILPPASDYKKAHDGNAGPNTGGMGAICPVPWLGKDMLQRIKEELVAPVFKALEAENLMYKGLLYFGVMVTADGPKILEFNTRFGDPEAQVLIPRIENDFCTLFEAVAKGKLHTQTMHYSDKVALGIVIAANGYPGEYRKEVPVRVQFSNHDENRILFHAGSTHKDGVLVTNGGRCFTCVGFASEHASARKFAYSLTKEVSFEGAWCRSDIGANLYNQN